MPVVITENDTSQWEDQTGSVYHFPKRYQGLVVQGAGVVYYKGRITDKAFASARLSRAPHYFGIARIGKVYPDHRDNKGNSFALIEDFTPFEHAVPAKIDGEYLESIPLNLAKNYWRVAVRRISQEGYGAILNHAKLLPPQANVAERDTDEDQLIFESAEEGNPITYFGTRYERRKDLRAKAIAIHGLECKACGFNFEQVYGEHAKGFIHIHHVVPISDFGGEKTVDPEKDLVTLCANCHAMVHRKRDTTLSIDELKKMLRGRWVIKD